MSVFHVDFGSLSHCYFVFFDSSVEFFKFFVFESHGLVESLYLLSHDFDSIFAFNKFHFVPIDQLFFSYFLSSHHLLIFVAYFYNSLVVDSLIFSCFSLEIFKFVD